MRAAPGHEHNALLPAQPRCKRHAILLLFQHGLPPALQPYLQQANRAQQVFIMLILLRLSLTLQSDYTMFTISIARAKCLLHGTKCLFPALFSPPMRKFALICRRSGGSSFTVCPSSPRLNLPADNHTHPARICFGSALWKHFPVIVFQREHRKISFIFLI